MLSLVALTALSNSRSSAEEVTGFDPGVFTLAGLLASAFSRSTVAARDQAAADLIARNGFQLSDDVERRIAAGFIAAPF